VIATPPLQDARPSRDAARESLDPRSGRVRRARIAVNSKAASAVFVQATVKRKTTPMPDGLTGDRRDSAIVGKLATLSCRGFVLPGICLGLDKSGFRVDATMPPRQLSGRRRTPSTRNSRNSFFAPIATSSGMFHWKPAI
jgi:hypothetical protein